MKLKETIERSCQFVSQVAEHKYGRVPQLKLSGHVNAVFPYIECEFSDRHRFPHHFIKLFYKLLHRINIFRYCLLIIILNNYYKEIVCDFWILFLIDESFDFSQKCLPKCFLGKTEYFSYIIIFIFIFIVGGILRYTVPSILFIFIELKIKMDIEGPSVLATGLITDTIDLVLFYYRYKWIPSKTRNKYKICFL